MKMLRRIVVGAGAAGILWVLSGCPSPLLTAVKTEIAKAPFTTASYTFLRQWGNAHPEYSFFPSLTVRADIAGNIYVGDSSFRIRKFTESGVLEASFNLNSLFIFGAIYDMALDPYGNLYVVNSNPQVQMYDPNGNFVRQWGSAGSGNGQFSSYSNLGVAADGSGNVYVVDAGNNRVQKFSNTGTWAATFRPTASATSTFSSGATSITVSSGAGIYAGMVISGLGIATNTTVSSVFGTTVYLSLATTAAETGVTLSFGKGFSGPYGIATDGTHLYVIDTGNKRVVVMDPSTGYGLSEWGGTTTYNGLALSNPVGIAVSSGTVYVVDAGNSRIVAFDTSGGYQTTWGSSATFTSPTSVTVGASQAIYVTDTGAAINQTGRVQKFSAGTSPSLLATWAETSAAPGNGVFAEPAGIAFDSSGNVYVSDNLNNRIEKFDSSGNFLLQWSSWSGGTFNFTSGGCFGIAADTSGHVYVSDGGNSRVVEFDTSGNYIKLIGSGTIGQPRGVGVDTSGNVYIADGTNYKIWVFNSSGFLSRSWGSQGTGSGQFEDPIGLTVDGKGNVWVSDASNNNVQKFDPQGNFLVALGGATFGSGPGQFLLPVGVAADLVAGGLYVVDFGNRRIQKFDPAGNFVTAWGGSGTPDGFGYPFVCAINTSGQVLVSDYASSLVIEFAPVVK